MPRFWAIVGFVDNYQCLELHLKTYWSPVQLLPQRQFCNSWLSMHIVWSFHTVLKGSSKYSIIVILFEDEKGVKSSSVHCVPRKLHWWTSWSCAKALLAMVSTRSLTSSHSQTQTDCNRVLCPKVHKVGAILESDIFWNNNYSVLLGLSLNLLFPTQTVTASRHQVMTSIFLLVGLG